MKKKIEFYLQFPLQLLQISLFGVNWKIITFIQNVRQQKVRMIFFSPLIILSITGDLPHFSSLTRFIFLWACTILKSLRSGRTGEIGLGTFSGRLLVSVLEVVVAAFAPSGQQTSCNYCSLFLGSFDIIKLLLTFLPQACFFIFKTCSGGGFPLVLNMTDQKESQ